MTATLERASTPSPDAAAPTPRPTSRRRRRWGRVVAVLLVPVLLIGWSYLGALTYPGSASFSVRTVDWLRSHGGAGVVNTVEVWHYSHQEPPRHGSPTVSLPPAPSAAQRAEVASLRPGHRPALVPAVTPALAGEASWTPGPVDQHGRTTYLTTWFRPDPRHPTVVVGALWLNHSATRLHLVAGTKEPGGQSWPGTGQIPAAQRAQTVAAFNSGFLMRDSGGGFWQAGRLKGHLNKGAAAVTIDRNGHAALGVWGRDVHLTGATVAVRQNLHLIVDQSQPVDGLVTNADRLWGSRRSQLQYTWRSGMGIDRAGNLVYVAGDHLNLTMLAEALAQAGSVRAMQLDIHTQMTTANLYQVGPGDGRSAPVRLLPTMNRPADRYLAPDQRDFFTVTAR